MAKVCFSCYIFNFFFEDRQIRLVRAGIRLATGNATDAGQNLHYFNLQICSSVNVALLAYKCATHTGKIR